MPTFSARLRGEMTDKHRAALERIGASLLTGSVVNIEAPDADTAVAKLRSELEPLGPFEVAEIRRAD